MTLTLRNLKKTSLLQLYGQLLLGEKLSEAQYKALLEIAVLLLNHENEDLKRLGYRIVLVYSASTEDYVPLFDVSVNKNYIPISRHIDKFILPDGGRPDSFLNSFQAAYFENFNVGGLYFTDQQFWLSEEVKSTDEIAVAVVAPTSYGKSDLILSLLDDESQRVCIVVPTKALISQTKKRIISKKGYKESRRVITHPEMHRESDVAPIYVMTQERALRLLRDFPSLSFDLVCVDEAHNILDKDDRWRLLASLLLLSRKRNPEVRFRFLTPFLLDSSNLNLSGWNNEVSELRVTESLKSERVFCYDFRKEYGLELYDQFFDHFYETGESNYTDEFELIASKSLKKNVVYINRPSSLERFARTLSARREAIESEAIDEACRAISSYLHKDYYLIGCLKKGIAYHHGVVPDMVKLYIEHLFSKLPEIEFLATTSTLLEGVNIPADRLFVLDYSKGKRQMSPSQFKNLVGRICRFGEVFQASQQDLKMLIPEIYIIASDYMRRNADIRKFVSKCMKVDRAQKEVPENVLLEATPLDDVGLAKKHAAEEYLENLEPGMIARPDVRRAVTDFGRSCFLNSVVDMDIFAAEVEAQAQVDELIELGLAATTTDEVVDLIQQIFLPYVDESKERLHHLKEKPTRAFYSMFLRWRVESTSLGEMIGNFIGYWKRRIAVDPFVFVGSGWGDVRKADAIEKLWIDVREKSQAELVNMAIVRIKLEQDFVDNELMKFVEVLFEIGLVQEDLYFEIKYGTADSKKIVLMKQGFTPGLASLLLKDYSEYVNLDESSESVSFGAGIHDAMSENSENAILQFELGYNVARQSKTLETESDF